MYSKQCFLCWGGRNHALSHKWCNTHFFLESSFNTDGVGCRKQDDFRLELFADLCTWLKTELEHSLFTRKQFVYTGADTSKDNLHG